ncbi:MAG: hypothetical protein HKN92_01230 [Chitinophagales bacterium]|nr:hypothetical protein [Chitinophagales bacterium]
MMRKYWNKIKRTLQMLGIAGVSVLFIIGLSSAMKKQDKIICKNVKIDIDYTEGLGFIDEEGVRNAMSRSGISTLVGKEIKNIDLSSIEQELDKDPFILKTEVYSNTAGDVIVKVYQKRPIIRLINKNRVSFYLTENKHLMPLSDIFTLRLLVVSGNIRTGISGIDSEEKLLFEKLIHLADFIERDPFWKAMISEVEVVNESDFSIVPIVGKHKVEFGDIDASMEEKFKNLKILYKEGMKYTGWTQYKNINLKFDNQIVCTKY